MCRVIDNKATGAKLKKLCEEHGLTAETIRSELQLTDIRSVYYWFSGRYLPGIDNLYMLAALLGTTIDDILVPQSKSNADNQQSCPG